MGEGEGEEEEEEDDDDDDDDDGEFLGRNNTRTVTFKGLCLHRKMGIYTHTHYHC
jgi:hypothetical protein